MAAEPAQQSLEIKQNGKPLPWLADTVGRVIIASADSGGPGRAAGAWGS